MDRRRGLSVIGTAGGPFHDPHADEALFVTLEAGLRPDIPLVSLDRDIDDPAFAHACVAALLASMVGTPQAP